MGLQSVTAFFVWCTVINAVLLIFSALLCTFAQDWIYRFHSRWYPMPRETFTVVIYSFIGLYKILFIVFNIVPLAALSIIG